MTSTTHDGEVVRPPPSPAKTDAIVFERFNLHANVRIAAEDDTGRERLCRYLTRPPFALGRFRRLRDGTIAYRVKKVSRRRATERLDGGRVLRLSSRWRARSTY